MTTSVVVVAYDAGPPLVRCLESLAPEHQGNIEVIVVDNGGGAEIEEAGRLPFVRIVAPEENVGYAAGSNLGAAIASGDVLVFLNPDTLAAPGAIPALARVLADESIGIAMARLRLLDRPELLNSGGNILHITGLAWVGGFGEPADRVTEVRDVPSPSGAALAIRADVFRRLDGFTEELFLYHEDVDLGWRARLLGLRVVVEPRADVYHGYEFGRNPRKNYFLERNRLVFVLSSYSRRMLIVLAPVLMSAEVAMAVLSAKDGWAGEKLAGWGWCVRHRGWLLRRRAEVQGLRRVSDSELAAFLTPEIDPQAVAVPLAARLANPVLARYWAVAKRAV
jgi:GT2 family glycosyltransferase